MRMKNITKLADLFYSLAMDKEKLPENSKNKKTVLSNIDNLENFKSRIDYAEKNFKHLSSGSSRVVFLTKDNTVIKLAKNEKGLAQNKAESNPKMKSKFLNKVLSKSKNDYWIEVNFLDKITEKEFEKLSDMTFEDFSKCISYALKKIDESKNKKPKNYDKIEKTDLFKEMKRLGNIFKLLPGDISRISSWGVKDKTPTLIDAGLTRSIYDKYYDSSSSSSS